MVADELPSVTGATAAPSPKASCSEVCVGLPHRVITTRTFFSPDFLPAFLCVAALLLDAGPMDSARRDLGFTLALLLGRAVAVDVD